MTSEKPFLKLGTEEEIRLGENSYNKEYVAERRNALIHSGKINPTDDLSPKAILAYDLIRLDERTKGILMDGDIYDDDDILEFRLKEATAQEALKNREIFVAALYDTIKKYGLGVVNNHPLDGPLTTHVNVSIWRDGENLFHTQPELRLDYANSLLEQIKTHQGSFPFFPYADEYTEDYDALSIGTTRDHCIRLSGYTPQAKRFELRLGDGRTIDYPKITGVMQDVLEKTPIAKSPQKTPLERVR